MNEVSDKEINYYLKYRPEYGLRLLHRKYAGLCYHIALRYLREHSLAEEASSEAFVSAFKKAHEIAFQGEGCLKAWMSKVTINHCLMKLRKIKGKMKDDGKPEAIHQYSICYSDCLEYKEIIRLIHSLPTLLSTVFFLKEIDGYKHSEIAELLRISESSSRVYLTRAKNILQSQMKKYGYVP